MQENLLERFAKIRTFIFDVDGVLAKPHMLVLQNGQLLRQVNSKDGFAIKAALEKGYQVIIITGGKSDGIRIRFENLGVKEIYLGVHNKLEVYEELAFAYNWQPETILYMGDDWVDFEIMKTVGLPTCPADAISEIQAITSYISPLNGGDGCARDVIEKVLKTQNDWF